MTSELSNWWQQGACRTEDADLFFPIGKNGPAALQLIRAKQVCAGCAVREECLRWAISLGVDQGVWGGLSEEERRALKRRDVRQRLTKS